MNSSDESLEALRDPYAPTSRRPKPGGRYVRAELERYRVDQEERIKRRSAAEAQVRELSETADEPPGSPGRTGSLGPEEKTFRDDGQRARAAQAEVKAAYDRVHAAHAENVAHLAADWERQREELVAGSRAEREALAKELQTASAQIAQFRQSSPRRYPSPGRLRRNYESLPRRAEAFPEIVSQIDQAVKAFQRSEQDSSRKRTPKPCASRALRPGNRGAGARALDLDARSKGLPPDQAVRTSGRAPLLPGESIEVLKGELARVESRRGGSRSWRRSSRAHQAAGGRDGSEGVSVPGRKAPHRHVEEDFKRLLGLSQRWTASSLRSRKAAIP
jgi:hypothetical protein